MNDIEIEKNVKNDVESLFPESFLEVGSDISTIVRKLKNYT